MKNSSTIFSGNRLERIWLLAKIEFKLRYYENTLGLFWALVKPLSSIFIYFVAFDLIMHQGVPQMVSYLFLGLVLWEFFLESTSGTITLLATKKYLYEYTNMNKSEIYFAVIGSNLIGLFFNLSMFILFYVTIEKGHTYISYHSVFIFPVMISLVMLSMGVSMILSSLYIYAKDIQQIWWIFSGLGFWLSPIVLRLEYFQSTMPKLIYMNPISSIIINARKVLMYHEYPDWNLFWWGTIYSLILLITGALLLKKLGSKAAEKL